MRPVSLVIADDHPVVLEGLVALLRGHGGFEVIARLSCSFMICLVTLFWSHARAVRDGDLVDFLNSVALVSFHNTTMDGTRQT